MKPRWRLLIFLAIVVTLVVTTNLALPRHLDENILFLLRDAKDLLIFLIASWIMGRIEHRTIADYGLPWRRMFRSEFWKGILLGFAMLTALVLALRVVRAFAFHGVALRGGEIAQWAGIYLIVFILVAVREEFRYRGYLLVILTEILGYWPSAILTSAIFGLAHLGNTHESWLGALNAGLFGVLLCLLLQRTGNLWLPIGLHVAFDWGETYFYGVADSGAVTPGHLLDTSMSGPAWLSGGSVGPEGSVLCTLLIAITFAIVLRRPSRR
ncbi:MAG TPA: type II CAAX endopeptidase family protein [Thermoanaerobaculia bacterium]|nr:type II CAAX endopeptidase family protein [Thermoanaerobaculia bacterium]